MAHLLGSKTCIDSLRVDIDDLQNVIYDIIGKTGTIKCHSWKFPDKLATDIDIKELLERYQYGKHEVDNQVSHIVLFEIIIDRLLLVLHGSWRFLHEVQTKLLPNTIDSSSTINQQTSLSVGLVVKKYWNKLLHLFTALQQHEINHKRSNQTTTIIRSKSSLNNEKQCQTIETSFSPCSSCAKLQQCFRDYNDSIINLCHIYNLPSSLAHHRCSTPIIPEWLSSDDINHLFDYQSKDFERLSKHLEYLNTTLTKTKNDLDLSENNCKQLNETNRRLQQLLNDEKQAKKTLQESYENKLIESKKQSDQHEFNLNEQIKLLTTQKINLEQQFKEINDECTSRGEQIEKLESSKNELKILTEDRIKSTNEIKILEQDRIRLQTELDVIKRDLEERNRELQKERMRIENMIRQEENSQAKQKTFIKSYEELSEQCESLKKRITELELERDELQKSLRTQPSPDTTKVQSLMETNNHVLQEVASLKSNIEHLHQQINEREQISVQHPDLNDNIIHDMQNQMRTNDLHIDVLQKQNDSLKTSLDKLLVTNPPVLTEELRNQSHRRYSYSNETVTPKPKQTPLWLLNNEILEQQQAFTETSPNSRPITVHASNKWIKSESDVNIETLPPQHDRSWATTSTRIHTTDLIITAESRPPTSRTFNNGRPKTSNRSSTTDLTRRDNSLPKSSRNIASAKLPRPSINIIHRCTTCNKTYDDKRNYDIHKLYCRT